MYELKPVSDRVVKMREKYRTTKPRICIDRYRLVTEFYQANPQLNGLLKRAKNLKNICENIPVNIYEDEVIVGEQGSSYRSSALYPDTHFIAWLKTEAYTVENREFDSYEFRSEDRQYVLDTIDYWINEGGIGPKCDLLMPDFLKVHEGNGVSTFSSGPGVRAPIGHFTANFRKAISKGFGAIKAEADAKIRELEAQGIPGTTIDNYNFYRAVSIICDALILLAKRYASEALRQYAVCTDPRRKAELGRMAETLGRIMEKPCETYQDALQCIFLYQTAIALDGQLHGLSYGRLDQYLIDFYRKDIAEGRLTPAYAQELLDLFYLKVAEINKAVAMSMCEAAPGYDSGQLMTLGGVDAEGNDATNEITYMMLQAAGRLVLHSPPQALRIHKGTPDQLWEAAICTTRIAGGVPSFESDEAIIPALMARGLPLESARDYCLIGCVEPSGCGDEWPACGGNGGDAYFNLANALSLAINDGYNIMPARDGKKRDRRLGPATGYLRDMKSIDEVFDAFKQQVAFFVRLHIACTNAFEYAIRRISPLPLISATIDGCMESGRDVTEGGAKYNSTGMAGIALGNAADSLQMIDHLVFQKKICTAAELHEALLNNWEGYESLHDYINTKAPHYGNGDEHADRFVRPICDWFADCVNSFTGPRGNHYAAGMYPVTTNVIFGRITPATADGRVSGQPLADGISPRQGMDTKGPTALLRSILQFDNQYRYSNGTLLNMKFDPNTVKTEADIRKLATLMKTYFSAGGMELQINIVDAKTLRAARENPEEYRDLVVRVAGFSAYFVELSKAGQADLISRTELGL